MLCASYSGDTEETLACFEAAGIIGAPRIALTTGGRLAEAARAEDVPVIGVPSGMQPRAAVLYMTVAALECAALCDAAPGLHTEIDAATKLLEQLVERWGPDSPEDSQAKALARGLQGRLPVIVGSGLTAALARRWKTQLNENAQVPAFASELPESNHNEICGWARSGDFAESPRCCSATRTSTRAYAGGSQLTCAEIERAGGTVARVESEGETRLERVLSLVLLGDLVSVYLAVLDGVDPTPIEAIDRLKAAQAEE